MFRWFDVIRAKLRAVFHRDQADAELDRELRAHLEQQIEEHVARGIAPDEARRVAYSTFGGVEMIREQARDARGVASLENLLRDLRHSLRSLLREPLLLIAATISIALGVGGNLAVFSLARAFIFMPPDVRRPSELMKFEVSHGSHVGYQKWRDLDESDALAGVAGFSIGTQVNWLDGDAATSILPMIVTANFFDVTGMPIALGRGFAASEAQEETQPRLVVATHEFWQRRLSGDSAVLGRALTLNGEAYTILGVLAPHARSVASFNIAPAIYVALNRHLVPELDRPSAAVVSLVGRLKPGQEFAQARSAIDALDRRLGRLTGDTVYAGVQEFAPVGTLGSRKANRIVGAFFALLGVVSILVLLIACANVAGLLVARGTRRRQEVAIRLAIGGSRGRVMQQFLADGFWLAVIGTFGGAALSVTFMRLMNNVTLPIPVPIAIHLTPDRTIATAALALVIATIFLCALVPAFSSTRLSLVPALKREEPFLATRRFTLRGLLLTGQVAISTVLLVTAFLFLRNLGRTQVTDPGFNVSQSLVAQVGFVQDQAAADKISLLQRAVERLATIPELELAAFTNGVPLTVHGGSSSGRFVRVDDRPNAEHAEFSRVLVGPRYFETLRVPVRSGREFVDGDVRGAPAVAIINEEFAKRHFAGRNAVGSHLRFTDDSVDLEIVGVVANGKHQTLGEVQRSALYLPLRQHPEGLNVAFVVARVRNDPAAALNVVRKALGELDRSVSIEVQTMSAALRFALLPSQIGAVVLGSLGALGLILAAFGLFALVSYNVSRRIGEIAIRSALGATAPAIVRLVVRDAAVLVGSGLIAGLAIAVFVTAPLATFLVTGLSATDPLSFVATAAVFALVSLLASWLPARSATRVNPTVAMRLD